jgi:superfamily II DNA/RNA helicase
MTLTVCQRITKGLRLTLELESILLPNWDKLGLLGSIKRALHASAFLNPSQIQHEAIPLALTGRDIVGIAETVR